MMQNEIVFLVGARAAGKTTIGKALAEALGYQFIDTDLYLLETTRETVADIVAREGWEGFRQRESEALRAVAGDRTVVATGGGMVLSEANRAFMREKGVVLYLSAPASVLAARLLADPNGAQRPTLTGRPIEVEMADVLTEREPLYQDAAHHLVDATVAQDVVLEQTLQLLRSFESRRKQNFS